MEQMPPEFDAKIFHVSSDDVNPFTKASGFVRELKAANNGKLPRGGVIVEFADGIYPLTETWCLDFADSGSPECPVLYRAANPGKTIFTGGVDLDWKPLSDVADLSDSAKLIPQSSRAKVLTAKLPDDMDVPGFFGASRYLQDEQLDRPEYVYPYALYQDGRRLKSASWPHDGFANISELTGEIKLSWILRNSKSQTFGATGPDGEKPDLATWQKEPDLYLHGEWLHEYVDTAAKPEKIDAEKGLITVAFADAQFGTREGAPFVAFNLMSELKNEGEWALDVAARRVYAIPVADMTMPKLAFTRTLLKLENVTDIEFEGFVFEKVRGHAVRLVNCRDVIVRTSVVRDTTGWGIMVEGGKDCKVEGCDLYDLGEGGVWLEGGNIDTLSHSGHVCDNCHINDYAKLVWNYNPGVRLFGCGNTATHNLIHNAPHQACFFYGAENRFAWNVVHNVCKFTDDAGAIYSYNTHNAWANRGNVIEHNVFHHIVPPKPRYCQLNAIYLDAFTTGTVVRGNIVSESSLGIFSSGGQDNLIEGNVIMNVRNGAIRRWNLGLMGGKTPFKHYIWHKTNNSDRESYVMKPLYDKGELYKMDFWRNRYPNMLKALDFEDPAVGHSSHFCTIRNNAAVASLGVIIVDPEVTEGTTTVEGNVVFPGDPGFVDYENLNWELREDSPARKAIGGATHFAEMGLYNSSKRISAVVKFGDDVTPPRRLNPLATAAIKNGIRYEDTPESRKWLIWSPDDGEIEDALAKCRAEGIPNLYVKGLAATPYAPSVTVCEKLAELDSFAWSVDDGTERSFEEKMSGLVDLAMMYPKLKYIVADKLDDKDKAALAVALQRPPQAPQIVACGELFSL